MTCFEIIIAIINVVAVIFVPIIAVKVGQYLQDRAQVRTDKMDIFKALMANRTGWSTTSVYAMNIIDIVFADDTSVRDCWKIYYEKLCIQNPNEMQKKQIQTAQYKLLETMAISLGYKNKITWETIQNPYVPIEMENAIRQQQIIQRGQEILADSMPSVIGHVMGGNIPQNQRNIQESQTNKKEQT